VLEKLDLVEARTTFTLYLIVAVNTCTDKVLMFVQAYLMGVVWSCYKYLTQAIEARGRRGSLDSEAARSPEAAEVQLVLSNCFLAIDLLSLPSFSCLRTWWDGVKE